MCGRAALSESALWPGRPCERKGAERKSVQRVRVVISLQAVGCGAPGGGVAGEAERAETAEMAERESSSRVQAPGGTRRGFFGRAGTSRPNVCPWPESRSTRVVTGTTGNGQNQTARCRPAPPNGTTALRAVAIHGRLSLSLLSLLSPSPGPRGNSNGVTHGTRDPVWTPPMDPGYLCGGGNSICGSRRQSVPNQCRKPLASSWERGGCVGGARRSLSGLQLLRTHHHIPNTT